MHKNIDNQISKARAFARAFLFSDSGGHDWWHTERVSRTAEKLALAEGADPAICKLAALLHDVGDHKLHANDPEKGRKFLEKWVYENIDSATAKKVLTIISEVSFKGANVDTPVSSTESAVVQDADRLDAIGAIGIARTFAFGGSKGREIFNPELEPKLHQSFAQYRKDKGPTINHFHEKLLLLKDRMQTATAKKIAVERHEFMELFLKEFHKEWNADIQGL